ncbi:MAG: ArsI/CadI family heavy metal resistance metalloenzyme [Xanthomonadales bacterium]|nr:ArsI/CadI family heavy metal resistance metalloenzyme [Xanthomonadales bacterium]
MRVHISLNVTSLEASTGFYSSLFGVAPSKLREDYANYRLDEPPIHLALQQGGHAGRGNVTHVGVELPDQETLAAWQERLERSGLVFTPENGASCCYAKADKLWLTDPDGQPWEIWVRTGEHTEMGATRVAIPDRPSACC